MERRNWLHHGAAGLVGGLVLLAGVACTTDDRAGGTDPSTEKPQTLEDLARQRDDLTQITDPPIDGPVVGTDVNNHEARVVDPEAFCLAYEDFGAYRTGYLEQLATATDPDEVVTWVKAHVDDGTESATAIRNSMTLSGGDVGMIPMTFVVRSDDWAYKPGDLDTERENAAVRDERLAGFDAAAAELC